MILDKAFDISALDTYDAEPQIRERIIAAMGDRESMTVREALPVMGYVPWVLCWLTKLGVSHEQLVELSAEATLHMAVEAGSSPCLSFYLLAHDWLRHPTRENFSKCVAKAQAIKDDADLPVWVSVWPTMTVMTIKNEGIWLMRPEDKVTVELDEQQAHANARAIAAIVQILEGAR